MEVSRCACRGEGMISWSVCPKSIQVSRVQLDTQVLSLSWCPCKFYRFASRKLAEKKKPPCNVQGRLECGGWDVE